MVTLTGFADEISSELEIQLETLREEEIRHLEFRGVWNTNVLKLTNEELERVKTELQKGGIQVSSIGSPIGKISITDPFEEHLQDFEHALQVADFFGAKYIRIFSFFIPEGEDPDEYRDEVMTRMKAFVVRAEKTKVTLLHENEKEIYGDTPERCLDILEECKSAHLRMAFDPANFVQCGVKPFTEAYPLLKDHIEYMHIKDAMFDDGRVVPCGEGDGEVREVLADLKRRGYNGFMSLEPHLSAAGKFSGFSGPKLFKLASQALKDRLHEIDEPWQ